MSLDDEIKRLQEGIKQRLNELRNLNRENKCRRDFIREKKLDIEYERWRKVYYNNRTWNKE